MAVRADSRAHGSHRRRRRLIALVAALASVSSVAGVLAAAAERANDEPVSVLERIRNDPFDAAGFVELSEWLFRRGDVVRAAAAAAEAVRLAPAVAHHHRLLGYLQAALGADSEAEAAFRRAAEIEPAVRVSLADFHLARAWLEYQEALRRGPPDIALESRLRAIAAAAEINPELKALMCSTPVHAGTGVTDFVPPITLGEEPGYALVVEKRSQTARLYRRQGEGLVLLQTYPCTTGQETGTKKRRGDRRTPDGVYVVTDLLPGNQLPEEYGALALPLSYPNAWDRRLQRDGDGIWLHGSDRLGSPFSPRDTRGCVIMRNDDLAEVARLVSPGVTPVLIAEDIPYRAAAEWHAAVDRLLSRLPVKGLLAVVGAQDYTVIIRREGTDVVRDFLQADPEWDVVASEKAPTPDARAWKRKIDDLLPDQAASLVDLRVLDGEQPPAIVIETSAPAQARGFRSEIADRLYLDLEGVRTGPVPAVVHGTGPWVQRVHIAAIDRDPPTARLVIDLKRAAGYRLSSDGTRITVSLETRP